MKVLSISLDKGLFDKKSDVFWRHQDYSSWVDKYFVIVPTLESENRKPFVERNLEVVPTNSFSRLLYLPDLILIAWKYRRYKFDLITVQDPFFCGVSGVLVKYLLKIPLNVQIHSEFFNSKYYRQESVFNPFLYFIGRFTLLFANTVRARNSRIKNNIRKLYPHLARKIGYIGVRLNPIYLTPLSSIKRDQNLIIANSRFVPQKNLPLMFASLVRVKEKYPGIKLKLFDVGTLKHEVKELIRSNKLTNNIELMGWQPPTEIKKYLDRASLFVLSSNHEGWSLVVLEALSRGVPVLMTDTGCAGEIVIDGKTGYVSPIGNVEIFTEKMIEVLKNSKKAQKMARAGRNLVVIDTSSENIKTAMLRLFNLTSSLAKN